MTRHEETRPINSDSTHDAEASTGHRWIQAELRLLRHGETAGYEGDLGLSDRGREQAREAAAALAAEAHGAVRVLHAPSVRARLTAEVLAEQLGTTAQADPGFANFTVAAGGDVREQAEVFGEYAGERRPPEELPGWLADLARFREIHVSGGDPIEFWLTTPLLGFEPPAVAVRRYWRAIAAAADDTLTVVAAHSGPMRALVAHAFHEDLGEPHNLEAVAIHLEGGRARVDYRGRTADVAVPDSPSPRRRDAPSRRGRKVVRASILRAADAAQTVLEVRRVLDDLREAHDGDRVLEPDVAAVDLLEEVDHLLGPPELGVVVLDVARREVLHALDLDVVDHRVEQLLARRVLVADRDQHDLVLAVLVPLVAEADGRGLAPALHLVREDR